jgi:RHS repeat-associated protein
MSNFTSKPENKPNPSESNESQPRLPSISLPKGGGAISGIGEKFSANPVTGTGSLNVPIFTTPGRSGFGPQLSLSYDSGSGNGPFGFGWSLSLPSITRKTDKGLPKYQDSEESDVFILSGAEDLVPVLEKQDNEWKLQCFELKLQDGSIFKIKRYRPRIEGTFVRIERWTNQKSGEVHWRSISKDNVTTLYGKTEESRIFDPSSKEHVFSWLISESYDDKGNAIIYEYQAEDSVGVDISQAHENNRNHDLLANRYLKCIRYGNSTPYQPAEDYTKQNWLFEVVFDYDEGRYETLPDENGCQFVRSTRDKQRHWSVRRDPFSNYRAGFEVRTYRLCQRVLMFHHFKELSVEHCLIRSTDFSYNDSLNKGPDFSFITKITQSGYVFKANDTDLSGKYLKKSLPPLEFEYSQANIDYKIHDIDPESLENLPYGLDGTHYQWVDLDGEGISGILVEQAGAWFYKRNISPISIQKDEMGNPVKNEYGDLRVKAQFESTEIIRSIPSLANLNGGRQQLLDLAGDGQLDLAQFNSLTPGFFERTEDQQWKQFTPFISLPNIDWNNPNLKFLDLTGDGHADIIITEDEVFTWYESLAEAGFSPGERVFQAFDEEEGPRLIFSDGTQSIYMADMSGDGLTDLVRIRNSEVCYWPNLGYGRFGAKVTMDNSPLFDSPDQFNQQRIRLADINGSGTTDIIYLKRDGVHVYFNQSGNGWTELKPRIPFPQIDNLTAVMTADLLGNGTACLVWSSPLPGHSRQQMRYIDLMSGQKPHLLVGTKNNLGAETRVHYAPSTKFYLEDQKAGKPWITRIPFPVHVVERVDTYDRISRNRFVTRYTYHHGYFDGIEREFRGFGMVEQKDTEEIGNVNPEEMDAENTNLDAASFIPPVLTRTWFHTGVYIDRDRISNFFAGLTDESDQGEYYREPAWQNDDSEARKRLLDDTILQAGLTTEEEREACRVLKGSMLRQEVYALDGTDKEQHPYTVTEQNFAIQLLQPQVGNRHAVFFTHAREAINYHYERNPNDPRVTHILTLDVDDFGNVLRSITVGYPRANVPERQPEQNETHLTLTLNRYANCDGNPDWRRIGVPVEARTYEIVKPPATVLRFTWDELYTLSKALVPLNEYEPPLDKTIPYEQWDWRKNWNPQTEPGGLVNDELPNTRLRLIEHVRTLYRSNTLNSLLKLGKVESLALPGESYKLSFTPGLLSLIYQKKKDTNSSEPLMLDSIQILRDDGGYILSQDLKSAKDCYNDFLFPSADPDDHWWIPSGKTHYWPNEADDPEQELSFATNHFFLPHRFDDPFGNKTFVFYDTDETDSKKNHNLLLTKTIDPFKNTVLAQNDYRVLQPELITDPNGNRSVAVFDTLGMVAGTAVMGKVQEPDGKPKGDTLEGFKADITLSEIQAFVANPRDTAPNLLKGATSRIIYDVDRFLRCGQPPFATTLTREIHQNDPGGDKSPIQISVTYSDGFGREVQTKIQAEPGDAPQRESYEALPEGDIKPGKLILENGELKQDHADSRWVGKGRTVYNNKGKPVKQYEPFFSATHLYEEEPEMTDSGVTPVLFYDPVERVVATLHPNHTYEKVVFDPWHQKTYDVNDTVTGDPRADADISGYVAEYFKQEAPDPDDWKTWLQQRNIDTLNPPQETPGLDPEKKAAIRTLIHADTPTSAYFDSLGRTFLTVAHNRSKRSDRPASDPPAEEFLRTRVIFDLEGNQREVIDAKLDPATQKGRVVMRYDYDMLGNKVNQASMEAGERWILNDVTGKPIRAWDSRNHQFRTAYDRLRRPTESYMSESSGEELLVGRTVYGETQTSPDVKNLRGKAYQAFDQAGVVTSEKYDFKGNLLCSHRQLAKDYKNTLSWPLIVPPDMLEDEIFTSSTTYDALNRSIQVIAPHSNKDGTKLNVIQPVYNEANLLEREDVWLEQNAEPDGLLDPATATQHAVKNINYDAKGQREFIEYGNGVRTTYEYDPLTFHLTNLQTLRGTEHLQDLFYTYDPAGNIIVIRDDAQQTIYFNGQVIKPDTEYWYDAIYRLIEASGREHIGQASQPHTTWNDEFRVKLAHPNDGQAMRNYFEFYEYDEVGNILSFDHKAENGNWIRSYEYNEESQTEADRKSNRLSRTIVSPNGQHPILESYIYDTHGNMTSMPHLPEMVWDFKNELQIVNKGAGCKAYYVYDSTGQRVRKVIEQNDETLNERIYIGGYEVYRQYNGNNTDPILERESLHIMDDKQRIALIDTKMIDTENPPEKLPETLIRYQFGNHLGSASLELDDKAQIISYEEYYPYGSTSYHAVRSQTETPKRYRYTGKERDEETGLYYHGARYYVPWLGKWIAADPQFNVNLYEYSRNSPTNLIDPDGKAPRCAGKEGCIYDKDADWSELDRRMAKIYGSLWVLNENARSEEDGVKDEIAEDNYELNRSWVGRKWDSLKDKLAGTANSISESKPVTAVNEVSGSIHETARGTGAEIFDNAFGPLQRSQQQRLGATQNDFYANPAKMGADLAEEALEMAESAVASKGTNLIIGGVMKVPGWTNEIGGKRIKSWVKNVLVGVSRSQFKRNAARIIRDTPGHPLKKLLVKGKFRNTAKGIDEVGWSLDPRLVEAGHVVSKKSGEPEKLILMSAEKNRSLAKIEHPGVGGYIRAPSMALDIGNIAVDIELANHLVKAGYLDAQVVKNATLIYF